MSVCARSLDLLHDAAVLAIVHEVVKVTVEHDALARLTPPVHVTGRAQSQVCVCVYQRELREWDVCVCVRAWGASVSVRVCRMWQLRGAYLAYASRSSSVRRRRRSSFFSVWGQAAQVDSTSHDMHLSHISRSGSPRVYGCAIPHTYMLTLFTTHKRHDVPP